MNLINKILWALALHDGIVSQVDAIEKRGLRQSTTIVRHLINRFEDWYAKAHPLAAEIANEKLTGGFVDEFSKLLETTKAYLPTFRKVCETLDEIERLRHKTIDEIFEEVDK